MRGEQRMVACLRVAASAKAGRTLSERFTHVRLTQFFAMLRLKKLVCKKTIAILEINDVK